MLRQHNKRGFTLVELLVVLAIITILIAILLPTVLAAKRHAQQVACQSNLRQLGIAMTSYGQDNRYFPTDAFATHYTTPVVGSAWAWPVLLRKHLAGNQKVFYCPAQDPRCQWTDDAQGADARAVEVHTNFGYRLGERLLIEGAPGFSVNGAQAGAGMFFSYGVNIDGARPGSQRGMGMSVYHLLNSSMETPFHWTRRFAEVKRPAEFIIMADTTATGVWDFTIFANMYTNTDPQYESTPATIHRGGANVLFCDGHVKWYLRKDLCTKWPSDPSDAEKQRLWNADNKPDKDW